MNVSWQAVVDAAHAGDVEGQLELLAEWLRMNANQAECELVRSCLESAAENCESAALDYYASTK